MQFLRNTLAILFGLVLVPACAGTDTTEVDPLAELREQYDDVILLDDLATSSIVEIHEDGTETEVEKANLLFVDNVLGSCPFDQRGWGIQYNTDSNHNGGCALPDRMPVITKVTDQGPATRTGVAQARASVGNAQNAIFNQTSQEVMFVAEGASCCTGSTADIQIDLDEQFTDPAYGSAAPQNLVLHTPAPFGPRGSAKLCKIKIDSVRATIAFGQFPASQRLFTLQQLFDVVMTHEILHCLGAMHSGYGSSSLLMFTNTIVTQSGSGSAARYDLEPSQKALTIPQFFKVKLMDYATGDYPRLPEN